MEPKRQIAEHMPERDVHCMAESACQSGRMISFRVKEGAKKISGNVWEYTAGCDLECKDVDWNAAKIQPGLQATRMPQLKHSVKYDGLWSSILHPQENTIASFLHPSRVLCTLEHPCIIFASQLQPLFSFVVIRGLLITSYILCEARLTSCQYSNSKSFSP